MRKLVPSVLVPFIAVCILSQAWGQDPPGGAPCGASAKSEPEVVTHESPATFSSRVNLVSVPVVIRDHEGLAVGDLKQGDFQLFDKGKPQIITKFTIQTSTSAPVTTISCQRLRQARRQ